MSRPFCCPKEPHSRPNSPPEHVADQLGTPRAQKARHINSAALNAPANSPVSSDSTSATGVSRSPAAMARIRFDKRERRRTTRLPTQSPATEVAGNTLTAEIPNRSTRPRSKLASEPASATEERADTASSNSPARESMRAAPSSKSADKPASSSRVANHDCRTAKTPSSPSADARVPSEGPSTSAIAA